jgi:uncharacterized membrane protein YgcG
VQHTPAGVQDFEFESFSADYFLSRDAAGYSKLKTVETFVAKFPTFDQNRGMIRAIPNDYDGVPLHTSVDSVVDENGDAVPFERSVRGGFTELALGTDDYVHGRTTYTITYTQENVVRAFEDTQDDEFYWDTNGTGFAQPFGTVEARIHVEPALTEYLTGNNACYRGVQGSTDTCDIVTAPDDSATVFTAKVSNMGAGENLTVVIGFTLGTFVQVPAESTGDDSFPSPIVDPPWWATASGIAIVVLSLFGAGFTIVWRFITPASAKGRGIIIPQYTVPQGINLLESAEIVGRRWTGVSAQIVSFAVRGKLRILDYPVTSSGAKFTLQLLDTSGVDDQELELLTALFGDDALAIGAVREVGVIDDAAARAVASVQADARTRVLDRGFKEKRSSRAGLLIALGVFLLIFVAAGLVVVTAFFMAFSGWVFFSIFVAFLCVFVSVGFAWRPPVLTAPGAKLRDYLLGMRDYLQLAEADRFRMLQSPEGAERVRIEGLDIANPAEKVKLYEKLLPFAVLWGIEGEWAKELTINYGDTAPAWFVSSRGFDAVVFSNALTTFSSTSVVRSTPTRSSGSSWSGSGGGSFSGGSFGGGFSGGGGGGGGGGGR